VEKLFSGTSQKTISPPPEMPGAMIFPFFTPKLPQNLETETHHKLINRGQFLRTDSVRRGKFGVNLG